MILKDGKTQDVKILSSDGASLQIQVGAGNVGIPLATVASVTMAPPAELAAVNKACEAGDYAKALPLAKAVATKYKGLPVDWARQALSRLGEIQVALGNLQEAEATYKEFQRLYPGAGGTQTEIGMARIAVARKDYDGAKQKLDPIAAEALKTKTPSLAKGAVYSQTFYLLGQIAEAQQQPSIALENYLRTVTIFSADRGAVAAAQQKADALRKNNPTLTVP